MCCFDNSVKLTHTMIQKRFSVEQKMRNQGNIFSIIFFEFQSKKKSHNSWRVEGLKQQVWFLYWLTDSKAFSWNFDSNSNPEISFYCIIANNVYLMTCAARVNVCKEYSTFLAIKYEINEHSAKAFIQQYMSILTWQQKMRKSSFWSDKEIHNTFICHASNVIYF